IAGAPPQVQEKILSICRERLASGGVALVSYNTLPGWSTWQSLRETILHHCRHIRDPLESVRQARRLLDSLHRARSDDRGPYWEMLRREIDKMRELSDWFLLHDHLEEDNWPIYFHQFVNRLQAAGLQSLGGGEVGAMEVGALPAGAADALGMDQDMTRQMQYLDLLQNRRFRMSLLCRPEERPNHALSAERLWDFRWSTP